MKTVRNIDVKQAKTVPDTAAAPDDTESRTCSEDHQLHENRGRQSGHDMDDWLAAVRYLAGKPAAKVKALKGLK